MSPDARCVTKAGGRMVIARQRSDFQPPADTSLLLWLDTGSGVGSTRASALSLPSRRGPAVSFTAPAGSYSTGRQAACNALALGPTSPGLTGTWGGAVTDGNWTVLLFLRAERLVNTYGDWPGAGPMTLFSSPAAGVTINLPSSGTVPVGATAAAGGPLDGVAAGVPWDVAFLGQWRQLCVRGNGSSRSVFVDGFPLSSTSGQPLVTCTAATPIVLCPACPVTLLECIVWNSALSDADIGATRLAQRTKWEVPPLTTSPLTAAAAAAAATAAQPPVPLPTAVPSPGVCWFDAQARGTLFRDDGQTLPALPGGGVRHWRSRVGDHRLAVPAGAGLLLAGGMEAVNGRPVVSLPTGTALATGASPLAGTLASGFTVVALWRLRAAGGHPLGGTDALLDPTQWRETLGVDTYRDLPTPTSLGAALGDVCLGLWMRSPGGDVRWRLNGLEDAGGGG